MQQQPVISSKKILLNSDYNYFDLLPIKRFHECNSRIPETILLEKGFIKEWVFNSKKEHNHPILKKKRENTSPLAVVKAFCTKMGYGPIIKTASNIREIRDIVKKALHEQKDYDFVKDKKVIEILSVSNETLVMSLMDFLDFSAENKYSEQSFYEKWKMIQEKVSFTKIDEYYQVQNVRHNHIIESKCQKIISVNTTEGNVISSQIEDDPYKNASPSKNFQIMETKNLEGYKFFDTFLNKKFFQMSNDIIEFIEKNLKCIVESINTRFVINKDREPYLVSMGDLILKPVKKIADTKQFQIAKEKGFIKVDEYHRFLEVYVSEHMERQQKYTINTPISERRGKCRGKFCKVPLTNIELPPLLQQKLKMPGMSASTRLIGNDLRDAVIKRKLRVLEKMTEQKLIQSEYEPNDESSQYSTSGQNEETGTHVNLTRNKNKQLKICHNCFIFYFHVNRFYELDVYGNLIEKKVGLMPMSSVPNFNSNTENLKNKIESMRKFQAESSQNLSLKKERSMERGNNDEEILRTEAKREEESGKQFTIDIKPVTNSNMEQTPGKSFQKGMSNPKFSSPSKNDKNLKKIRSQKQMRGDKNLSAVKSKVKLDPLTDKKALLESSGNPYVNEKTNRLLTLTKLTQPMKLQERNKAKTMHPGMLPLKERRPENHEHAIEQILNKFTHLPDSSREEIIYYAKKYYKDNLPQPLDRRYFSSYYSPMLYEFMSTSPIGIHPKRKIKKRPEMSLKRLSELTDYPEIVSRSQFVFDTVIVNQQTTIPFCVLTTKVVNPDCLRSGIPFENIFIVNDMFDCFIEHISMAKQLLEEEQMYNKRIILFNYPGQSHTIYNSSSTEGYSGYFAQVMDKLMFRLSLQKGQLKIIDLEKDLFKFYGFGLGGYLVQTFLGSYASIFKPHAVTGVMLVNSFMQFPQNYKTMLKTLLQLYSSNDPTAQSQAYLFYNKAINSEQTQPEDLDHKAGLNPIRLSDRVYLLTCLLSQIEESSTLPYSIEPIYFEQFISCQVSVIYGRSNVLIPKNSSQQILRYRNNPKQQIPKRVLIQLDGGHDIFADNFDDICRVITMFAKK